MSQVTSIDDLVNNSTEVIDLPPFTGTDPIYVRVKQLSILGLCKEGVIPNQLLGVARKLFYREDLTKIDLKEYGGVLDIICKETLVEPSMEDLTKAGLKLTDMQKFELYTYSQSGVEGLKSFRKITKSSVNTVDGQNLQSEAQ